MRVISGYFKGKKILQPIDKKTRPLRDLVKESIFNIIKHSNKFEIDINGATILDLFSGAGSFGIECLSRGAKEVIFIENYKGVLPILKKNLSNLKSKQNFKIIEKDVYNNDVIKKLKSKFDIIYLDPPFKDVNFNKILEVIIDNKLVNRNGIFILHRHKSELDNFPMSLKILEKKFYGNSKITFLNNLN